MGRVPKRQRMDEDVEEEDPKAFASGNPNRFWNGQAAPKTNFDYQIRKDGSGVLNDGTEVTIKQLTQMRNMVKADQDPFLVLGRPADADSPANVTAQTPAITTPKPTMYNAKLGHPVGQSVPSNTQSGQRRVVVQALPNPKTNLDLALALSGIFAMYDAAVANEISPNDFHAGMKRWKTDIKEYANSTIEWSKTKDTPKPKLHPFLNPTVFKQAATNPQSTSTHGTPQDTNLFGNPTELPESAAMSPTTMTRRGSEVALRYQGGGQQMAQPGGRNVGPTQGQAQGQVLTKTSPSLGHSTRHQKALHRETTVACFWRSISKNLAIAVPGPEGIPSTYPANDGQNNGWTVFLWRHKGYIMPAVLARGMETILNHHFRVVSLNKLSLTSIMFMLNMPVDRGAIMTAAVDKDNQAVINFTPTREQTMELAKAPWMDKDTLDLDAICEAMLSLAGYHKYLTTDRRSIHHWVDYHGNEDKVKAMRESMVEDECDELLKLHDPPELVFPEDMAEVDGPGEHEINIPQ
ncbi:hypothetical protein EsH8_I_000646 [Colletotrichum jinshuiense]